MTPAAKQALRARLGAALLGLATATSQAAPAYAVVPAQSSLTFIGSQQGEKFTGTIRDFDARIQYGADDLAGSRFDVTIRVKSMDTKSPDRDQALATGAWFDVAQFPTATFRTTAMRTSATGPVGDAELVIKGHAKRIAFPFTWRATTGGGATLDAKVTLDRVDFGLGTGEWADDSLVGRKVDVVIHLALAAVAAPPPGPPKAAPKAPKH